MMVYFTKPLRWIDPKYLLQFLLPGKEMLMHSHCVNQKLKPMFRKNMSKHCLKMSILIDETYISANVAN